MNTPPASTEWDPATITDQEMCPQQFHAPATDALPRQQFDRGFARRAWLRGWGVASKPHARFTSPAASFASALPGESSLCVSAM